MRGTKLLSLISSFCIFVSCVNSQCLRETECSCIQDDNMGYDLTALKNEGIIESVDGKITFQACKNADLNPKKNTVNSTDCKSSSLCIKDEYNNFLNAGTIEETRWGFPISKRIPFLIIHHDGYRLKTQIELHCCTNCVTKLENVSSLTDKMNRLKLTSPIICETNMKHGELSTGSILVILFLIFSGLYFIGGAIALRCLRGAVGWELLPNYDFWSELPGLVRDGVTFTLSGCSENTYEQI